MPNYHVANDELIPVAPAPDLEAAVFKARNAHYLAYMEALQSFRLELLQCIHEEAKELLEALPRYGMLSIHELLEHLEEEYGELVFNDIVTLLEELNVQWPANSNVTEILSSLNKKFDALESVDEHVSDKRKILSLRTAMLNMTNYAPVFQRFFVDHGRISDQRYADLVKMVKEYRNNNDNIITTNPNGYTTAAANLASGKQSLTKTSTAPPKPLPNLTWPDVKDIAHCTGYCGLHGFGGHNSVDCRNNTINPALRDANLTNFRNFNGNRKVIKPRVQA
jgi:hypothetical protein